ncbi:MAG: phenylalanine--tRNA ligase subunit beta [Candidatus Scalindua sediminis]|nr:phenylalanine--tRNA ligase subunit beta [Candidatus Scalindua sediminis]
MKVSYNWLKDYVKHNFSVKELSERLTNVGLVVDTTTPIDKDSCLDIEVTSNRPDCLGFIGIAREVAAVACNELIIPDVDYATISEDVKDITNVTVKDKELCPRYTARIIKNVSMGPSPEWLQKKINTIGLRPVNNIVDITNYVLMESGQPLHAFDFDKLSGKKITVRRALNGEVMVAIDGSKCTLTPDMLVIADSRKPVAIAGLMGGRDTEVSDTTKNILLESAFFEPGNVRRTSRKLGIRTDSSYRFERRVDPECVDWASRRAAKLIQEIAGGEIAEGVIDRNYLKKEKTNVTLRIARLNSLLGIHIEKDLVKDIMERLQFKIISETKTSLKVNVPTFRGDVYREIDLIEEVARIHGYDNIPTKSNIGLKPIQENKFDVVVEKVRNIISGLGFSEVITDSIVGNSQNQHDAIWSDNSSIKIVNPIRQDENLLRKTLVHNLLRVKKHNQNYGIEKTQIYELSKIYLPQKNDKIPEEKECLCILGEEGFLSLKGVVEAIHKHLNIEHKLESTPYRFDLFRPGKSAKLKLGGKVLGYIGELSSGTIKGHDFRSTPCITELNFNLLVDMANLESSFQKIPSFPTMMRDLAIVSDEKITWNDIRGCIESLKIDYVDGIEFFDVYRGKQVEQGKKSIAFRLIFRADDRTLKSEEVDALQEKILENLNKILGVKLRT